MVSTIRVLLGIGIGVLFFSGYNSWHFFFQVIAVISLAKTEAIMKYFERGVQDYANRVVKNKRCMKNFIIAVTITRLDRAVVLRNRIHESDNDPKDNADSPVQSTVYSESHNFSTVDNSSNLFAF
jgi:hypothetical protein